MSIQGSRFSMVARCRSVGHALKGLRILLREQHNARIHFAIALVVVLLGFGLKLAVLEWLFVILVITWVISLEALNSALEYLCDRISPEQHPLIAKAKDVAAAAVLISALGAALIGLTIFLPKILGLLDSLL